MMIFRRSDLSGIGVEDVGRWPLPQDLRTQTIVLRLVHELVDPALDVGSGRRNTLTSAGQASEQAVVLLCPWTISASQAEVALIHGPGLLVKVAGVVGAGSHTGFAADTAAGLS